MWLKPVRLINFQSFIFFKDILTKILFLNLVLVKTTRKKLIKLSRKTHKNKKHAKFKIEKKKKSY